jgi:hypothetical protein
MLPKLECRDDQHVESIMQAHGTCLANTDAVTYRARRFRQVILQRIAPDDKREDGESLRRKPVTAPATVNESVDYSGHCAIHAWEGN